MSFERWAYLYGLIVAALMSVSFAYVASDPMRTHAGRAIVRALDSWYLSARWSADPKLRLQRIAVVCALLAILALVLLILDPQPRYQR